MSDAAERQRLLFAWRAHPPRPATGSAIIDLLKRRFRAYEVPVSLFPRSEYEIDEDVHADDVWKLFFITDPARVSALVTPAAFDREDWPPSADEGLPASLDEDWPEIFGSLRNDLLAVEEVGYRLFTAMVGKGMALGVALESPDGVIVDGFKVYGPSDALTDVLIAHVGWEKYRATDVNPYGVVMGDPGDEDFARYLRAAHSECLLRVVDDDSM